MIKMDLNYCRVAEAGTFFIDTLQMYAKTTQQQ